MEDLTIESFFVNEYKRVQRENSDLKEKIECLEKMSDEYGLYCFKEELNIAKIDVCSEFYLFQMRDSYVNSYEKAENMLSMDDDELFDLAVKSKSDYVRLIDFEKSNMPYTVVETNFKGKSKYAYSPDQPGELVRFYEKPMIGEWITDDNIDAAKKLAIIKLRENLESAKEYFDNKEN